MIEIEDAFDNAVCHSGDVFVADYTEQTQGEKGVIILEQKPKDIMCFHLSNPHKMEHWGVNFEECPAFFKGISQCECMFVSRKAKKKGWVCLVEMKYCKEKNIANNMNKACLQLRSTLAFLTEKDVLDSDKQRIYLNVSIPDYSHREPFTGFIQTQDYILNMKKIYNVVFLGYNNLLILNEAFIQIHREVI